MGGDELELVKEAFASNYVAPLGPQVDAFEREFSNYTGISHCVALASGTAATHLALWHMGVRPGDEVMVSTLTFIASVTPAIFLGASPVFIDCDRETWTMDPALLEQALERAHGEGRLPKAVIPTDLYGQCADHDRIRAVCERYGVPVVVDAAEAMGAKYRGRHAGNGAYAGVFSFNGNKIMTTSGGGMLASEDKTLIEHARFLSQQAREREFCHYEHREIGHNYRMSNILAAIGRGQLRVLDGRVVRRRAIFDYYRAALGDVPGIEFMPEAEYGRCNRWLTVIVIDPKAFGSDRETVRLALEKQNIESRPVWKPMHLQPVFERPCPEGSGTKRAREPRKRQYETRVIGGSVSEDLFARGLCLPSGTALTNRDLDRVIEVVRGCRRGL